MTNAVVINGLEFRAKLAQAEKSIRLKFQKRNRMLVQAAMRNLLRRTPVHTGQTVRSYVASNGRPIARIADKSMPVEPTNPLPLGSEALRGASEGVAMATLSGVNFSNPFDNFFVTNRSPAVHGLEEGELPGKPFVPRSPQGMFAVTLQELTLLLDSGRV